MESKISPSNPTDANELSIALSSLGMLYGARHPPVAATAGSQEEAESIRAFIVRERPHLLSIYSMETLIQLVREARAKHAESPCSIEQLRPDRIRHA